jgi:hypothetical protein
MSNVVNLLGEAAMESGEPDGYTIAELERLLEAARSGEVQGVTGAYLYRDGTSAGFNAGWRNRSLLGALEISKHRLTTSLIEGDL